MILDMRFKLKSPMTDVHPLRRLNFERAKNGVCSVCKINLYGKQKRPQEKLMPCPIIETNEHPACPFN